MQTKKSPNVTDVHVGGRVRMRRTMLGMTQMTLGGGLGVTFQQVQKYEMGTNRIGASRLQQAATILQVPVSFFFEGAPAPRIAGKAMSGDGKLDLAGSPDLVGQFFSIRRAKDLADYFVLIGNEADRHVVLEVARLASARSSKATAA